ncbi:MAG: hypothetical protein QHH06_13735 [Clostridiales bacterium]|nr:hypothetical protein [Eubacteriales bacterium]MDH7567503.1 hypothetical protein [Clostridiales bacterium]
MDNEVLKLTRAIEIMKALAEGTNPFTGLPYEENSLINDPRMIRCFYYIIDTLKKVRSGQKGLASYRKDLPFVITPEEKARIVLPEEKIGVNTFAKCVNSVINPAISKKLTGMALNSQLKKMGILREVKTEQGKIRTTVNDKSAEYGIEIEEVAYNGNVYHKIVFNQKGKKYLLDHLEEIMSYK